MPLLQTHADDPVAAKRLTLEQHAIQSRVEAVVQRVDIRGVAEQSASLPARHRAAHPAVAAEQRAASQSVPAVAATRPAREPDRLDDAAHHLAGHREATRLDTHVARHREQAASNGRGAAPLHPGQCGGRKALPVPVSSHRDCTSRPHRRADPTTASEPISLRRGRRRRLRNGVERLRPPPFSSSQST